MTPPGPMPFARELVPAAAPAAPTGFVVVDEPLRSGVPHRIELAPGLALVVILPTGVVGAWRDAEPAAVVCASDSQVEPTEAPAVSRPLALDAPPLRLVVEVDGETAACLPPIAGLLRHAGVATVALELVALAWRIHAGTVLGAGDYGSRVRFAWRPIAEGQVA